MNREERRDLSKRIHEKITKQVEDDLVNLNKISVAVHNKVSKLIEDTHLDHVQVNYVNTKALKSLTDVVIIDMVKHDDMNELDYIQVVVYFGKEEVTEDKAKIICKTCEQSNLHNWIYSDKDKVFIDSNGVNIEELTVEAYKSEDNTDDK